MKVHMVRNNCSKNCFQNPKFIFCLSKVGLPIYEQTDLKTAIVILGGVYVNKGVKGENERTEK